MSAKINFKNLNYIRATKEPIKGHLLAECFDDVNQAFGNLHAQVIDLTAQLAQLKNAAPKA